MSDTPDYRELFLAESSDFIEAITQGLLNLERDPGDTNSLESVFRGAHSLKGMAGAMAYSSTVEVTHRMEELIGQIRSGQRTADRALLDLLLEVVDVLRLLIDDESSGRPAAYAAMVLDRLAAAQTSGRRAGPVPITSSGGPDADDSEPHSRSGAPLVRVSVVLAEDCVLTAVRAYMVLQTLAGFGEVVGTEPDTLVIDDESFGHEFAVLLETPADPADLNRAALGVTEVARVDVTVVDAGGSGPAGESGGDAEGGPGHLTIAERQTVRVAVAHLDALVDLVGEVVTIRSRLERIASEVGSRELDAVVEDLERVARELRHGVLRTRTVPVGNVFGRFAKVVRDLARALGKDVRFETAGLDVELDRIVLDEIGDPVLHLLRNSIDHGIESAGLRHKRGKSAAAHICLSAMRERDAVRISVSDDGGGIDPQKVWRKAVAQGLVRADQRSAHTDADVLNLVFVSGFSTASEVSEVSGRGVGMDVVKATVERIGGSVSIQSAIGQGTSVDLLLPVSVAIVQALLVCSSGQIFAFPLSAVDEVSSEGDEATAAGHEREGAPMPPVSLHRLDELMGLPRLDADAGSERVLVLSDAHGVRRGVVTGEVLGRSEIVVKPISRLFAHTRGVSGVAVLADGGLALVVDPRTLFASGEGTR